MFAYVLYHERGGAMSQDICNMMQKGALLHKRFMTKLLERFSLTFAQYQVLQVIHESPGISAKDMLTRLDTDKATLSGIVSRLEAAQMIERKKDSADRRLLHLHVTDSGQATMGAIASAQDENQIDLLRGLRTREVKHFIEGFKTVLRNQEDELFALTMKEK